MSLRTLPLTAALGLVGLAACDAAVDPITVAAGCPEQPIRGPNEYASVPPGRVIDDFEDGDLFLTRVAGRSGAWAPSAMFPAPPATGEASGRCAARGGRSGHFNAGGPGDYGTNWAANLIDPLGAPIPYDARSYSGISFWMAAGSDDAPPFETSVGVVTTDVAWNGGVCTVCMDYYETRIALDGAWRRFVIHFADLAQRGFGIPQVPLHIDDLISFVISPQRRIDVWIDDVRFEP